MIRSGAIRIALANFAALNIGADLSAAPRYSVDGGSSVLGRQWLNHALELYSDFGLDRQLPLYWPISLDYWERGDRSRLLNSSEPLGVPFCSG